MPTQEVPAAARTSSMLGAAGGRQRPVVLDGGTPESWGDGSALYSDTPRRTLEVFASGWSRWRCAASERWERGEPLALWQRFVDDAPAALPREGDREAAGILTVAAYDLKHWIERLPRRHGWPAEPILYSALYDWRYVADRRRGTARISAQSPADLERALRWYASEQVHAPLSACAPSLPRPLTSAAAYLDMVRRAKEYIAAGDVYQVNLAQSFRTELPRSSAAALFAAWTGAYAMPFAAYVDAGEWALVSNTPECLLVADRERAATFPIKGTRRRPSGDERGAKAALPSDPKERAEHVMIVDLERNDLGRVCVPGGVEVAELGGVRSYPFLEHMVSEVRGRLRPGTSASDLLRAMFPGGSITGAPKVRAMQIIEEIEPCARGFYTGAAGWTELDGRSRFNLLIRTAVVSSRGLEYHAGGGIVADSEPEMEYEETLLKSESLFRILRVPQAMGANDG
jgi:anthranilate/para-aminobenzoate synthase component I